MNKIIKCVFILSLASCGFDGKEATENADQFAREMLGMKNPKVKCQNMDSDGDGYVSCTVVEQSVEKPEQMRAVALECSGWLNWNDSCRLMPGTR